MRRALTVATAFMSAVVVSGCGSSSHQATSLPGLTTTKLEALKAIVRRETRILGDAHPSSAIVFATRWHEATVATGVATSSAGSQPVYLVVVRGHFHCDGCSDASGSGPWSGDILTFVLDRSKLRSRYGGGGVTQVDTSGLGPGLPLVLG